MKHQKNNYLFYFIARIDGKLTDIYRKTSEPLSKTKATKIGKAIAKENGWRLFSMWADNTPQFNMESSTIEVSI